MKTEYMKPTATKLLSELLKDSRKSDRALSKSLGVSQPTVSRLRSKLVKNGLIQEFTIIPDFAKLGYELFAVSCAKFRVRTNFLERATKWLEYYPNVILFAKAEGMGKNQVCISLHKSYTDYSRFASETQEYWGDDMQDHTTLLVSLTAPSARPFSLRHLAQQKQTT
jgi:DNA-binding Lrp family transcriptional regulator